MWITNGSENRRVPSLVSMPDGWHKGRTISERHRAALDTIAKAPHGEARRQKSSASHKAAWADPDKRQAMLAAIVPFHWITDGVATRQLPIGDALPDGWTIGRPKRAPNPRPSSEELHRLRNHGAQIYYVYVLYRGDTGAPFYVGKGKGNRWLHHERDCRRRRSQKDHLICKLLDAGLPIPKIKVLENLTSAQASEAEIALIAELGKDTLLNLTDGGEGVGGLPKEIQDLIAAKSRAWHAANPSRWITDGKDSRKVLSSADIPVGWREGRTLTEDHREALNATGFSISTPEKIAKAQAARQIVRDNTPVRIWINDGVNNRQIEPSEPIPVGWVVGHMLSEEGRASVSAAAKLQFTSEEAARRIKLGWEKPESRAALMASRGDQAWITNGTETKRHWKSEPVPDGWRRGRGGVFGRAAAKAKATKDLELFGD